MGQSMTLMGFYQDRLQSSTHAVRPASACTQPSADGRGDLSVTEYANTVRILETTQEFPGPMEKTV